MTALYEAMFLLDNQVVREDWKKAKGIVTGLLEKHGAKVHSARRWDERKLAYPIKKKNRATYLLTYTEIPNTGIDPLRRDLEISEDVLRYLFLTAEEVPQEELDLASAELSDDFIVPEPPADDHVDEEEEPEREERKPSAKDDDSKADDSKSDEDGEKPAEGAGEAKAEAPADENETEDTEKKES